MLLYMILMLLVYVCLPDKQSPWAENPKDDPDKQSKDAEFIVAVFGPDIDLVGGNTSESFMGPKWCETLWENASAWKRFILMDFTWWQSSFV